MPLAIEPSSPDPAPVHDERPLAAVAGQGSAEGGWVAWRGGEVFVCWPEPHGPCAAFVRVWPVGLIADDPRLVSGCRPDAAAFVDPRRVVLRCGADDTGMVVERSGRVSPWIRDTVAAGDVRPRRPTADRCGPEGRRVVVDPRGSPTVEACSHSLPPAPPCAGGLAEMVPASGSATIALARTRPPRLAGVELDGYVEIDVGRSIAADARSWEPSPRPWRTDAGLTVVAGVRVGFDPGAGPRWHRAWAALERRRIERAVAVAVAQPRTCARAGGDR